VSLEVLTLDYLAVPQTKFVIHSRAQNPLIFKEPTRRDPIGVTVFFVVKVSQAFSCFQTVHAKAVVGAGSYTFVSFDVDAQNSSIVLRSQR
jgi:hypothetical protein